MSSAVNVMKKRLKAARAGDELVRIVRSDLDDDGYFDGFVIYVGKKWALIDCLEDSVYPDGYVFVRIEDVTSVERRPKRIARYIERALEALGRTDSQPGLSSDATAPELLQFASQSNALVSVHTEDLDPGYIGIGKIVRWGKKSFDLLEIDPAGTWISKPTKFKYWEVTRVDFGDRYVEGLTAFGDPFPVTGPMPEA